MVRAANGGFIFERDGAVDLLKNILAAISPTINPTKLYATANHHSVRRALPYTGLLIPDSSAGKVSVSSIPGQPE
jgi:hypothetical protein